MTPAPDHHNNLTALRWFAACLVLYGHAHALLGLPEVLFLDIVPMGLLGVYIFFAISGYLVAQSWTRDPHVLRFLARRSLRIFPGLVVCTLLSVLVLGPLLTTLDANTYWRNEHTLGYLTNMVLYISYHLPGVFANNAWPHAVNGSLWSLPVEFAMYLLLALVGFVSALSPIAIDRVRATNWLVGVLTLIFLGLAAFWALPSQEAWVIYRTDLRHLPLCGVYFMVGASLYCFKLEKYFTPTPVLLALAAWFSLSHQTQWFAMVSWLILPFAVLALGLARFPLLARMQAHDYSYGIYIYAFPVQQTLVSFWPQMPLLVYLLSSFVITVALAALSWHFVEKPALKLKPFRG